MKALALSTHFTEATIININKYKDAELKVTNYNNTSVLIYDNGIHKRIDVSDVIMIKAESNYSYIILENNKSIFTSRTIKHWAAEFKNDKLLRVHKSFLINIDKIIEVNRKANKITLADNNLVSYSREMKKIVLNLF